MFRAISCMFLLSALVIGCAEPEEQKKDPFTFPNNDNNAMNNMANNKNNAMMNNMANNKNNVMNNMANNKNNNPDPPDTYEFPVATGVDTTLTLSELSAEDAKKICLYETELLDISSIASTASRKSTCYQDGHKATRNADDYAAACKMGYDQCVASDGLTASDAEIMKARMDFQSKCDNAIANTECTATVEQFEACYRKRFSTQREISDAASCDKDWYISLTRPPILDECETFSENCKGTPYNLN